MESMLIVLGVIIAVVAIFVFNIVQTKGRVQRWAELKGYSILRLHYRAIFTGPFTYARLRGGTVYRIRVGDKEGKQRNGFIRCHGWFSSMADSNMEVMWDKE